MTPSPQPLDAQIALVTGAGRGIGAAIATRLATLGAITVLVARSRADLDTTAEKIRQLSGKTDVVECDITSQSSVDALARHVETAFGRLDILVNNAGIGSRQQPLHELPPEMWDQILNTNLRGVYYMIRAFAPMMIRASAGHVINISSGAGKNPLPNGAAYAASKWGLNGLSYSVAEELRRFNIRVSIICPGSTHTSFSPHEGKDASRMLQPDDIAHVVEMLVTQEPQSFVSEVVMRPTQKP